MSEFIRNQYGKVFKIAKYNLDGRPDTERNMYICLSCKEHNYDKILKIISAEKKICYEEAIKYFVIWIAKKNITFHSIVDDIFAKFLHKINEEFKLPSETEIRLRIKNFSDHIIDAIYQKLKTNQFHS